MGVEAAGGPAKLGRGGHLAEQGELAVEPGPEHGQLLTQAGGRGGLAVGAGQHRHGGPARGQLGQHPAYLHQGGHEHRRLRLAQAQRNGRIV